MALFDNYFFAGLLQQIKLLFGPLVIQLVWYILKQLFTSVSVKVVDIYLHFGDIAQLLPARRLCLFVFANI